MKLSKKQIIGFALALLVLVGMNFFPTSEALTVAGRNAIGILITMLVLLVSEAIPIPVTCLVLPAFLVLFGCVPMRDAYSGFSNHIMFFVLASFGISAAITKVNLSRRMLIALMNAFGGSVKTLLFAMMVCTALISSIVSNVATTAVFLPMLLDFLNIYSKETDKKKTGQAFMIALPIASMIGGMMTPAGSSLNLLCIAQLETLTGMTISFTQWMVFGIPITLVILPISWWLVVKLNPPAEMSKESIAGYLSTLTVSKKWDVKEKMTALIMAVMFVLWVLSSWFPYLQVTAIAIVGVGIMMFPKIEIFTWKEFEDSISWEAFFLLGAVMCVGNAIVATKASTWLAAALVPAALSLPVFFVLIITSLLVFVLLVPVPVAPALIGMLAAPLVALAVNTAISPIIMIMLLGLCVANCYLLPLDTVPLITYMTGYYKMGQLAKTALPHQIILTVLVAVWLPIAGMMLGI